jgi:hypothetical protein
MARLRHTARKSMIPFLLSLLAERPLCRTVSGQSSHLKRLHHRLHEEQEHQRQQREQQGSSSPPEQEVESVRRRSSVPQLEAPPAPPQDTPAVGGATGGGPGGDLDDDDDDGSYHSTEPSEEQEAEGWVARPITRDAARGCHFHDALDTLLRRAFDRHTWSIEYRCVVYQHSRRRYPDRWEATCLVRHPEDDLRGAEAFSEHYSISERDTAEAAMQDAARRALSQYCSLFGGVVDGLNLRYYPRRPTGSTESVVVSPIGEDNPRLSSTVNLVAVLNTELDHSLDELSRARTEIAELRAELAERRHQEGGSPAPVGTQHPYRSPPRGHHTYGSPACRTMIDLDP